MCSLGIEPTTFIKYTLLVPGWTHFAFRTALILHSIDSTRCWIHSSEIWVHIDRHDSIMQLLQICRLHIHDANLPFHHIPKVLYWIEIWWLWRPFEESEHITIVVVYSKAMHYYNCTFETTVLPNMKIWKVIIIYSLSFCFKEVRFFFFIWTEKKILLRMWVTKHLLDANDFFFVYKG